MLLPFIAWAITGVFFFIKPGYSEAYQSIHIKTYPSVSSLILPSDNTWTEVKSFRTVLGRHLLVKSEDAWTQVSLETFEPIKPPTKHDIKLLIEDAIQNDPTRYGKVHSIDGLLITTSTNIAINLNWHHMSLIQKGADTDFINTMYKVHYLQWSGVAAVDKILGIIGLVLVVILGLLGLKLSFKRKNSTA